MEMEIDSRFVNDVSEAYAVLRNVPLEDLARRVAERVDPDVFGTEMYAASPLERLASWARRTIPAMIERSKEASVAAREALRKANQRGDVDRIAVLVAFLAHQSPVLAQLPIVELTALAIIVLNTLGSDEKD
jgi:hypothetical protein